MSTAAVYTSIRSYLETNWTTTDLVFENEDYEPRRTESGTMAPFVEVEVSGNIYDQVSIGTGVPANDRWREEGQIWLHIMVQRGTGSLTARQYATSLTDLFRGALFDPDVECRDMSVGMGESATEDGNWWRLSVSIEWIRG